MTLVRRHILTSLAIAVPAAALVYFVVNALAAHDAVVQLERVATAHVSSIMRDACEQDPQWFLAGPRVVRPPLSERQDPDADVKLPRPSAEQLPFEIFAYDDQYTPTSVAGGRFPDAFKRSMRASNTVRRMTGEYDSATGTGLQTAIVTGWTPGTCAILLFRQQPAPGQLVRKAGLFGGLFILFFTVGMLVTSPTAARIRRLSLAARKSAQHDFADIVEVSGSDEIGSFGALFNDTAADIRRKAKDASEREEALRRYVENTTVDVGEPLARLERDLGRVMAVRADRDVVAAVKEAHRLTMQVQNLAAAIRLRGVSDTTPREPVNLASVVRALIDDRASLAAAAGVTIDSSIAGGAGGAATISADKALIEQAIANVLDNAIIYNREGGSVRIELHAYDHGQRFKLLVADTGAGVSDEAFEGLTANKRFRGDESRTRRPGGRGLGLALAREVADRFGLQFDLRQPTTGGMEAEFSTR
jgi:signal transduction histidine kinase